MATKKGKERLRILVWFRKLRGPATAASDAPEVAAAATARPKGLPALVRVLSLPVTKTNLRTWVPSVLASHSEKLVPRLQRSASHQPLPLTAKNVAALNASQSVYSTRCSCPAELMKGQALHRAWDDWDAASSSGMSSLQDTPVKRRATCTAPIPEELQLEAKEVEGAASSSSSPAASQIPAGHAALNTGTTTTEATSAGAPVAEPSERLISHYIDNLTLSQPHGESISQHVRGLQGAIDHLLQQNTQLRQELQAHDAEAAGTDAEPASSDEKALHQAMNAVCADLVKLQLEVRAKDQVISKLRMQINSVQQMLQA